MITKKPRILFAEQNPQQRQALEFFFEDKGVEVHFSDHDGRMVLQDIEDFAPHIVVLDVFMPHYDAVAVKNLCQAKEHCPLLFVAQGSYVSDKIIQYVMDAGYDRYLLRPFAFEILLDMTTAVFGKDFGRKSGLTSLECRAEKILKQMGMPSYITGYKYLRQGISMAIKQPLVLEHMTKEFYPGIAKLNNTTASSVERAIRNAVSIVWERGNLAVVNEYFCCGINSVWGKPANKEFVAIVSDRLRAQIRKENMIG
ncbi:MAG: response regulator [Ruminococcaceae bacterium]|nr:response regulator [Oscillospiraceae bacterium]